jgi:SAM-dependent methyltransferase
MPEGIPPVRTTNDDSWRTAVVGTYDDAPDEYSSHRRMQDTNYLHLSERIRDACGGSRLPTSILDLGCGDGLVSPVLFRDWDGPSTKFFGVDAAAQLLRHGQLLGSELHVACGDLRALPFPDQAFDLIVSNSVLHWLNAPEQGLSPLEAIQEAARVLSIDGIFGASVAAAETAASFGAAYRQIIERYSADRVLNNQAIRADPVGGMTLPSVVRMFQDSGLTVLSASMQYEPTIYASAEDYVRDVRSYGFGAYTAPFRPNQREEGFIEIERAFLASCKPGPYLHRQYMLYVVAARR